MSQLELDDQLDLKDLLPAFEKWIGFVRLQELRPGEQILDERVPQLLLTLKQPTFVTIDHGFWKQRLQHPEYCIVQFELTTNEQAQLPELLRRFFRLNDFRTRAARMGKVARVTKEHVVFWENGEKRTLELPTE